MFSNLTIQIDELAAAMLDIALHGNENDTLDNPAILLRGREALKA